VNSGKPLPITKRMVWEVYKLVKEKGKAAGVDGQSLMDFADDLENNLYRLESDGVRELLPAAGTAG
jgi:RNA-directed DNA polymerase